MSCRPVLLGPHHVRIPRRRVQAPADWLPAAPARDNKGRFSRTTPSPVPADTFG